MCNEKLIIKMKKNINSSMALRFSNSVNFCRWYKSFRLSTLASKLFGTYTQIPTGPIKLRNVHISPRKIC